MGKPRLEPLDSVDFRCNKCGHKFTAAPDPDGIEDYPTDDWHPFLYTHDCVAPGCDGIADQTPSQRGLLKAWANATGPRTPEGKAASAKNLEGHPTPEEAKITRMNALKHGFNADVISCFPARPGKYPHCKGCQYHNKECMEDPPEWHENPPACLQRTELYMRHHIAFELQDPKLLSDLRANTQAKLHAMVDDIFLAIAADGGPRIRELQWYYDKDGICHIAEYVDSEGKRHPVLEIKAHPLLRWLIEFVQKNNLTLADMGMTPKVQDEQDLIQGYIEDEKDDREKRLDLQQKHLSQNAKLLELIQGNTLPAGNIIDAEVLRDE